MDVLFPMAYLSYYRHSFFSPDLLLFVALLLAFYRVAYHVFPSDLLAEKPRQRFDRLRSFLFRSLLLQLLCGALLWVGVMSQKPILVHAHADLGLLGHLFVVVVILRFVNILLMAGFLATYRSFLPQGWALLLWVLLLSHAGMVFYLLFPTLNRALTLYEMFYHIRNMVLDHDPNKKQKTYAYLRGMACVPPRFYPLYEDEWARTFKNRPAPTPPCQG